MTWPGSASVLPTALLYRSTWRFIGKHPWQMGLNFLGILLGVMMVVAIDLASNSAQRALDVAMIRVSGNISHQIVSGSAGVANAVYTDLRRELGLRRSAPTISGEILVEGTPFSLLGLDAMSELSLQRRRPGLLSSPDSGADAAFLSVLTRGDTLLMSNQTARRLELESGQVVQLASLDTDKPATAAPRLTVNLLTFDSETDHLASDNQAYVDIDLAQQLLRPDGTLDSIDLVLDETQAQRVATWLPAELSLVEAEERNATLDHMSRAFHTNLLAMSLLSLLVAGLLIYNTVTLSVLQREKTLGILRSQGVSRAQVFVMILAESAIMGIVASAIGVLLGHHLGKHLLTLVVQGLPASGLDSSATHFVVNPASLLMGFVLGLTMTLLSATLPAWQATHCAPVTLQQRQVHDQHWRRQVHWLSLTGIIMMLAGTLLLMATSSSLLGGFVALTLLVFGFCFLIPGMMNRLLSGCLRLCNKWLNLPASMVLRSVQSGLRRTGLAVAALTVAISVSVGVGIMVESFRSTVEVWLAQSFQGDIEVTGEQLSPELQTALSQVPGVAQVSIRIERRIESQTSPLRLIVRDRPAQESFYLQQATNAQLSRFEAGEGILISEALAWSSQLQADDTLSLVTDRGPRTLPILGIFHDYTPGSDSVAMHQVLYRQLWDDQTPSRLTIFSEATRSQEALMSHIREQFADQHELSIFANRQIHDRTLAVFDRTFAITGVLRILAIVIAFIGVLSALMALLLERNREFATLRATGMTPWQIAHLVLGQTSLMGLFAGLLSLPLGWLMSEVLIEVINRRSFGWSMQQTLPLPVFSDALLLALTAALIAGLYPALRAARISPALALREE